MGNKVISFSLWGTASKYTVGAVQNIILAKELLPDWKCRFYTNDTTPKEVIDEIISLGGDVVYKNDKTNWGGLFWRFLAADSDDIVIVRDADSRISKRDIEAVEEWLSSGKSFHIMRDHPRHDTKILGGMWGVRHGKLKGIKSLIDSYIIADRYNSDQEFLSQIIFPKIKDDCIVHDPIFSNKPFPSKRVGLNFVGEIYEDTNRPKYEDRIYLKNCLSDCDSDLTLHKLGIKHGTDKYDNNHTYDLESYLDTYERLFSDKRFDKLNILEIGVLNGSSLRMWKEYFPNSNIIGLDIDPKRYFKEDRISVYIGDQSDENVLNKIIEDFGHLDIIIDDGAHVNELILKSFNFLKNYLTENSFYIIEDTRQTYHKDILDQSKDWPGMEFTRKNHQSIINNRKDIDRILLKEIENLDFHKSDFSSIHIYPMIIAIEKNVKLY